MTSSKASERQDTHDVSIVVDMLPSDRDGRSQPTAGRTWFCRLKIEDRFFEARLVGDAPSFRPGARTEARVKFLNWPSASRFARPDASIEIWELRRVATGFIKAA